MLEQEILVCKRITVNGHSSSTIALHNLRAWNSIYPNFDKVAALNHEIFNYAMKC